MGPRPPAQAYATTRRAAVGIVAAVLATAAPRQGLLQYSIRLVGRGPVGSRSA